MNLLSYLREQTQKWAPVFPQKRTLQRAVTMGFGLLCGVGKRTVTRAIGFHGKCDQDWSADYKLFSRSPWEAPALFSSVMAEAIESCELERIVISIDDTKVWRTGQKVPQTQWFRDPLGPPFQINLRWGHRFLAASVVQPLYQKDPESSPFCVPVRFEIAPVVKKPGLKAKDEILAEYRRLQKLHNLSRQFVTMGKDLRQSLDDDGRAAKQLVLVGDGSFANRTVFGQDWESARTSVLVRCRKDLALCRRAGKAGARFYDQAKFTPEQVRKDDRRAPWQTASVFHGGRFRDVRFKEISPLYWQRGAGKRPVRLLVVAPVGYRTTKNGRTYYRQPAYLLTTDLQTSAGKLLQDYFDRWGIEVNHRDQKQILGLGDAQVWNEHSVSKVPALIVAMYSWLLLAGLHCYGSRRTADYLPLPKWRKAAKRPSCQDLVNLLRRQISDRPIPFPTASAPPSCASMILSAAG